MLELLNFTYNNFNIADTVAVALVNRKYIYGCTIQHFTAIFHVKVFEAG